MASAPIAWPTARVISNKSRRIVEVQTSVGILAYDARCQLVGADSYSKDRMMAGSGRKQQVLDVAIVGGGVSGVYAGWRLLGAQKAKAKMKAVTLFEQSDRIGGRLLSVQVPGIPHVWCELGGMRFTSNQALVRTLVQDELLLPTHIFPVHEPENLNYLRGVRLRERDFADPAVSVPYALDWAETDLSPGNLLGYAIDQLIPGATKMPSAQLRSFLESYVLEGRHIYDWGFWNLLARGLSHEGYELARATGGYDTPCLNWNALDTISLNFDLAPDVSYFALDGGYQSLPLTLAEQFEDRGGKVELGHSLESFDVDNGEVVLQFDSGGAQREVRARSLILAMPRRSLELLAPTGAVLGPKHPHVRELIESVTPIPLFKLCIAYKHPWWESVGVTQGRSQTDLPIRQCYYWATGRPQHGDPDDRKSVMLATYDDGSNVDFWNGYSNTSHHRLFVPIEDQDTRAHPGSQEWRQYKATRAMVAEGDRQLREMHGLRYSAPAYEAAYIDWGADPFGGGVNFWNIHARSSEVVPKMIKPVAKAPVYVCGEAYSNGQGWVEGALETAEMVLQQHFRLSAPAWAKA
jgi:monoamine oxidase